MEEMFQQNNIPATKEDLCTLFFPEMDPKSITGNEYLDFYQFMGFALSLKADQDFREFMRNLKKKIIEEREKQKLNESKRNLLDNGTKYLLL